MSTAIKRQIEEKAKELGFAAFGVTGIDVELRKRYYLEWIADNKNGCMDWMENNNERRLQPSNILPEARSVVALGMNYYQEEPQRRGRIAKYALGKDYHPILYKKLKKLCTVMRELGGEQKPYVDTGPVLEKPIASLAGLGWMGKSTILLNKEHGTWLFLGIIITTLDLPNDEPARVHCGKCTRCIDACPTEAITAPYQLDARKCISYLTIEHKGSIPMEYRRAIGDHLYGCDDCLDVCPWNRWAKITNETKFAARDYPDLVDMLKWTEEEFQTHFAGTPIKRAKRERWLRNVCVVLGNTGNVEDIPALTQVIEQEEEMVQEHALWAINEIKSRSPNS